MVSEEDQRTSPRIGFAGLSSMVSDVDGTIAAHEESVSSGKLRRKDERPLHDHSENQPTSTRDDKPSTGRPAGNGLKWLFGIGVVIIGAVFLGALDKTNTTTRTSTPPSVDSRSPKAERHPWTNQIVEQRPPVGNNLSLGQAEIRYCLSEDVRLEAARRSLNKYSESQVNRFNVMINDFNSRCSAFRYRQDTMDSARADVERNKPALEVEGRNRFLP